MLAKRSVGISRVMSAICLKELQALAMLHEDIQAAFISTADGYEVAAVLNNKVTNQSIASMTISMHGLGEAVVSEARQKHCQNVIIESENGKIVMLAIHDTKEDLLLSMVTDSEVPLGQLLWSGRACAKRISEKLLKS